MGISQRIVVIFGIIPKRTKHQHPRDRKTQKTTRQAPNKTPQQNQHPAQAQTATPTTRLLPPQQLSGATRGDAGGTEDERGRAQRRCATRRRFPEQWVGHPGEETLKHESREQGRRAGTERGWWAGGVSLREPSHESGEWRTGSWGEGNRAEKWC